MMDPMAVRRPGDRGQPPAALRRPEPANLADILERVLDKGIVIAGDIQVNLLDIELLTIKLRLVIASVDRAKEMGIDWWEHDPTLCSGGELAAENRRLRDRVAALEAGGDREAGGEREAERHDWADDREADEEDRRG
jgi:gas vesicle protein GvpA/GvpJ/GvpM family